MDEAGFIDLNRKIGEAEFTRDDAFLRGVLSDELVFKRASGAIVTKEEYLTELKKPENTYEYLFSEDIRVTASGNAALVSLLVYAKGRRGEKEFSGVFRNQRVFVRKEGNWQCSLWVNSVVS